MVKEEIDIDGFRKRKISRYLPFFRFVSLLKHGLYIPNIKQLSDRNEGMIGVNRRQKMHDRGEVNLLYTASDYEKAVHLLHVSCWYDGVNENYLMWKAYGNSEEAVMVESSEARLEKLYRESEELYFGYASPVKYYEIGGEPKGVNLPSLIASFSERRPHFEAGTPDLIDLMPELFCKYNHYDGENEFRLVCLNKRHNEKDLDKNRGLLLYLGNPQSLIEKVRVSPFASELVFDTVSLIVDTYCPGIPVVTSKIELNS